MRHVFKVKDTGFTSVVPIMDPMLECVAFWPPEEEDGGRLFHFVPVVIDNACPMRESENFVEDNFRLTKPEAAALDMPQRCMCAVLRIPPMEPGDELGPVGFHFGEYGRAWPVEGCDPSHPGDLYRDGELVERGHRGA